MAAITSFDIILAVACLLYVIVSAVRFIIRDRTPLSTMSDDQKRWAKKRL